MSKKKNRADELSGPSKHPVNTTADPGLGPWVWRLAIALTVVVLYWRSLGYPFLIPGEATRLLNSPKIIGPAFDWGGAFSAVWEWQPLAWLSHMADFSLFGAQPGPQRFVSLMLHLTNALLTFGLLRRMTSAITLSGLAALLFAIHPLRIETVIWLVERRTLLATFFALLAMRAYVKFLEPGPRPAMWRAGVFGATALAALSHPVGAVVPLLLLLLDKWPLERTEALGTRLMEKAELAAISLFTVAMSVRGTTNPEALWTNGTLETMARLTQNGYGVGMALLKSLIPFPLDQYNGLDTPVWGLLVGIAFVAAVWLSRSKALGMGFLWFLVAMLPTLGLVHPEVSPWRDSGTYLAHIGLMAGLVWFLASWDRDKLAAIAMCAGLIWFGLGWLRVGEWSVGETLLRKSLERGGHPLAKYQLSQLLLQTGRVQEGEKLLQQVRAVRPKHLETRLLLATIAAQGNRRGEAEAHLRDVIQIAPERSDGYFALALLQTTTGQAEEGARLFAEALKRGLTPDQEAQAENAIGVVELNAKRYSEALKHLARSIELAPKYASAQANHARAVMGTGRTRQAYAYIERARLYTNEAKEVVDAWTEIFNQLQKEDANPALAKEGQPQPKSPRGKQKEK